MADGPRPLQWFSYRQADRSRPVMGDRRPPSDLDKIQPNVWLADYTIDLLDMLHVLTRLVALEDRQADLLTRIQSGGVVSHSKEASVTQVSTIGLDLAKNVFQAHGVAHLAPWSSARSSGRIRC
jgi:hypothetical protein